MYTYISSLLDFPPSYPPPFYPSRLSPNTKLSSLCRFLQAMYFIHGRVYIEEGNSNPFQYSCLENPMDGGAWWARVHGVSKSRTRLSNFMNSLTYLVYIQTFNHYSLKSLGPFNLHYCAWESQYSYKVKKIIK